MEKWYISAKKADFNSWSQKFAISPVLARIIRNRDIVEEEAVYRFLQGELKDCYSPWLLQGMEDAVNLIIKGIREKYAIRIIGDYDVDGICSSYILTRGLRQLGANVDTAIPHRIHDGYGLNDDLIEEARKDGINMIITCDNGIAAAGQIQLAIDYGMTIIITDHHEVPYVEDQGERREILPPAQAIVNPKQSGCSYPYKNICGGLVAYKVIQALTERMEGRMQEHLQDDLLQFAAMATVCDVMELRDENRIIVKEGLLRLRKSDNLGIRALLQVNNINQDQLSAYHLGFILGPSLNAAGRLDTAHKSLELLECGTWAEAVSCASELKALNDSRKNLTLQGVEAAETYLKEHNLLNDKVFVAYLPEVHESLAGIIAGRIRENHQHPVFILTRGEEGIKGSGRSIETYHMYEGMTEVKHLFIKFGGHKLAAGLTLDSRDYETGEDAAAAFRMAINQNCQLGEEDFIPKIHIDIPMPVDYADMTLCRELSRLEPYGVGNPKPLFAQKELHFMRGHKMGARQNCARFQVITPENTRQELVFFGDLEQFETFLDHKYGDGRGQLLYLQNCDYQVSVTYQLGINSYRGKEKVQFVMQNYC